EPARQRTLEALVAASPDDLEAHRALGHSYDAAGRPDDAIAMLTRADRLARGGDPDLRRRLAELHLGRAREGAAAAGDLAKVRALAAQDAALLLDAARVYTARK